MIMWSKLYVINYFPCTNHEVNHNSDPPLIKASFSFSRCRVNEHIRSTGSFIMIYYFKLLMMTNLWTLVMQMYLRNIYKSFDPMQPSQSIILVSLNNCLHQSGLLQMSCQHKLFFHRLLSHFDLHTVVQLRWLKNVLVILSVECMNDCSLQR